MVKLNICLRHALNLIDVAQSPCAPETIIFKIKPLTNRPGSDGSLHYRMYKGKNFIEFSVLNGEMSAYTWNCPGHGRVFLTALEAQARIRNLKLTIPTVLNPKLEKILVTVGYSMKKVSYLGDVCELWSKNA